MTHVPYRSNPQYVSDVVAGHLSLAFIESATASQLIAQGKVRGLASATTERLQILPDIPTLAEATGDPDIETVSWHMLFAPAATPKDIVDRLACRDQEDHHHAGIPQVPAGSRPGAGRDPVGRGHPGPTSSPSRTSGARWCASSGSKARNSLAISRRSGQRPVQVLVTASRGLRWNLRVVPCDLRRHAGRLVRATRRCGRSCSCSVLAASVATYCTTPPSVLKLSF